MKRNVWVYVPSAISVTQPFNPIILLFIQHVHYNFLWYTLLPFTILLLLDISCAIDIRDIFHFLMTLFHPAKALAIYPNTKMYVLFPLRERGADEILCASFSSSRDLSVIHHSTSWIPFMLFLIPSRVSFLHISFGISLILKHLLEEGTKLSLRKKVKTQTCPLVWTETLCCY